MVNKFEDRVKVYSRVKPEFEEELRVMAEEYAMSKSALIAMTCKIGLTYIKAMSDIDGVLPPRYMADVLQILDSRGVELVQPELRDHEK